MTKRCVLEIKKKWKGVGIYDVYYPYTNHKGNLSLGTYPRERKNMRSVGPSEFMRTLKPEPPISLYHNPKTGLTFFGRTGYKPLWLATTMKGLTRKKCINEP